MQAHRGAVLTVLARHLGRPASTLHLWYEIERDLEMTPLELVLLAAEIGDLEDAELDVAGLTTVRTVSDLLNYATRELARARIARFASGDGVASSAA